MVFVVHAAIYLVAAKSSSNNEAVLLNAAAVTVASLPDLAAVKEGDLSSWLLPGKCIPSEGEAPA